MQDYVTHDVVVIWQLVDDVIVDDVDILYVKRKDCSGSHKYSYRGFSFTCPNKGNTINHTKCYEAKVIYYDAFIPCSSSAAW
jgi:hypothetical protein